MDEEDAGIASADMCIDSPSPRPPRHPFSRVPWYSRLHPDVEGPNCPRHIVGSRALHSAGFVSRKVEKGNACLELGIGSPELTEFWCLR